MCGNEFIMKSNQHYFCSESCRRKYRDILESGTQKEFEELAKRRLKNEKEEESRDIHRRS